VEAILDRITNDRLSEREDGFLGATGPCASRP
jgi:hypothetical protein